MLADELAMNGSVYTTRAPKLPFRTLECARDRKLREVSKCDDHGRISGAGLGEEMEPAFLCVHPISAV